LLEDPGAMITLAAAMVRHPGVAVRKVAILTTSGGAGALAADALAARGVGLARFAGETAARFDAFYSAGQAQNPIDLGGRKFDEAANVSKATAQILCDDAGTDALLLPITTAPMLPRLAEELVAGMADAHGHERKPAFYVMQPGRAGDGARAVLSKYAVPYTDFTGEAIDALVAWHARSSWVGRDAALRPPGAGPAANALRGVLDESAAKTLLAAYGVPVNNARLASDAQAAARIAADLGFPVVMKIVSPDIVHKSDSGGVAIAARRWRSTPWSMRSCAFPGSHTTSAKAISNWMSIHCWSVRAPVARSMRACVVNEPGPMNATQQQGEQTCKRYW